MWASCLPLAVAVARLPAPAATLTLHLVMAATTAALDRSPILMAMARQTLAPTPALISTTTVDLMLEATATLSQ